ncbi:MAG: alpha/beta fold hydrolase [Acidimicrobiaceae bacterium]|nr:alpha/beta fold hydrolase [Ilumatobacter sp.]MCB9379791.1 alpha/beta fold hydrolase [Acidimicrobiaceae bacterium]MCO5328977.1 alpha/beta fold hydrolase [Ilumatobacteraceae bacterium]
MSDFPPPGWHQMSGPLAAQRFGPRNGERFVFVHGFTQTGNSWKPIAERMLQAGGRQAIVVDLPGHGGSDGVRADLRRTADMVARLGGDATYIGYSLGGRVCLHLALMYPHLARRMVLIGANPGIDDADERAARRLSDDAIAERIQDIGVPAFIREWAGQPLFGTLALSDAEYADRCRNTAEGLASSLTMAGTGAQGSLWPRLRELAMPILALAGAEDLKFAAIAEQLAGATLDGTWQLIPGAAHAAHLQQPEAVMATIERWLPPLPA